MAKRSRQSILKRQRELKKAEKAEAKRQKRQERRQKDDLNPDESGPPIDYAAAEDATDDDADRTADDRESVAANVTEFERKPTDRI